MIAHIVCRKHGISDCSKSWERLLDVSRSRFFAILTNIWFQKLWTFTRTFSYYFISWGSAKTQKFSKTVYNFRKILFSDITNKWVIMVFVLSICARCKNQSSLTFEKFTNYHFHGVSIKMHLWIKCDFIKKKSWIEYS